MAKDWPGSCFPAVQAVQPLREFSESFQRPTADRRRAACFSATVRATLRVLLLKEFQLGWARTELLYVLSLISSWNPYHYHVPINLTPKKSISHSSGMHGAHAGRPVRTPRTAAAARSSLLPAPAAPMTACMLLLPLLPLSTAALAVQQPGSGPISCCFRYVDVH